MSIKPIGFLYRLRGKADITLVAKNKVKNFEQFNPKWVQSDALYALPDTHRVVSVELLILAELLFRAESERVVRGDWEFPLDTAAKIRAIIEDKP